MIRIKFEWLVERNTMIKRENPEFKSEERKKRKKIPKWKYGRRKRCSGNCLMKVTTMKDIVRWKNKEQTEEKSIRSSFCFCCKGSSKKLKKHLLLLAVVFRTHAFLVFLFFIIFFSIIFSLDLIRHKWEEQKRNIYWADC